MRGRRLVWVYTAACRILYPPSFRRECGREMAEAFADRLAREWATSGPAGRFRLLARAFADAAYHGTAEWMRAARGHAGSALRGAWSDVRHAYHALRGSRAFVLAAVGTLALGIGANTAVFGVVDAVLLRPLPYPEPDRLVRIWRFDGPSSERESLPYPDARDLAARQRTLAAIAPYARANATFDLDGVGVPAMVARVPPSFFGVLRVSPAMGRIEEAATPDGRGPRVVVLGHTMWRTRFSADPEVVGRLVRIDGEPHTITAVMPSGFEMPRGVEAWVPLVGNDNRNHSWLQMIGRLEDDVSPAAAQADLSAIVQSLEREHPGRFQDNTALVVPLHTDVVAAHRPTLMLLFSTVGVVLAIACLNVANLSLLRTSDRTAEYGLRQALGASRLAVTRQALVESVLVGLAGGAAGAGLAWAVTAGLLAWAPEDIPRLASVSVNATVLGYAVLIAAGCGVACGLVPALRAGRGDPARSLADRRSTGPGPSASAFRRSLIVAEVGLAVLLAVGAALLVRTMAELQSVELGFDVEDLYVSRISVPPGYGAGDEAVATLMRELEQGLRETPGVVSAGAAYTPPFVGGAWFTRVFGEGRPVPPRPQRPLSRYNPVTPGFLETLGVPLVAGRHLEARDDGTNPVVVINEALANILFPGEDPLGKRMTNQEPADPRWLTVVGVVGNTRNTGLRGDEVGEAYQPHAQFPEEEMYLVIRSPLSVGALSAAIRPVVERSSLDVPLSELRVLGDIVADERRGARFAMTLLGAFAALALVLAAVGTYAVIARAVDSRRREYGVRLALGEEPGRLARSVTLDGLLLIGLGVVLGVASSVGLGRWIEPLLFGVDATDPLTLGAASAVALGVGLSACLVPARRASSSDPMVALRTE